MNTFLQSMTEETIYSKGPKKSKEFGGGKLFSLVLLRGEKKKWVSTIFMQQDTLPEQKAEADTQQAAWKCTNYDRLPSFHSIVLFL